MAIITEEYKRSDGVNMVKTYSDDNRYVVRAGIAYVEAHDPKAKRRKYTEGDPLPDEELTPEEALAILTGEVDWNA